VCGKFTRLYQGPLFSDALDAVNSLAARQRGRPAGRYRDRSLHALGLRAAVQWIFHVRESGEGHLAAVRDDVLRPLAERLLYIVKQTPRYSNTTLAWFALKRLLGWSAPTGRYGAVAERLLLEWRDDDLQGWWKGAGGKVVERMLYNRRVDVEALKPVPVLQGVFIVEPTEVRG